MAINFADPPNTTAEDIADALVAEAWLEIADPEAATGESLAIALEGIDYHDFADPVTVTPEEIALLLNEDPNPPGEDGDGGGTSAKEAWRAW